MSARASARSVVRAAQRGFTLIEMMVVVAIIGLLALMFISLSARTYGANADNIADEMSAQLNFAHSRAVSTSHYHCVEITTTKLIIWQAAATGMVLPTPACPNNPGTTWLQVQAYTFPKQTTIADVLTAAHPASGTTVTANPSLDSTAIIFRPDGSMTATAGATVFITDSTGTRKDRVIVYGITGDVYPRKLW